MTTTPTTWTADQRALVDVVLHGQPLRVPCIIREVRSTRILIELVGMLGRFWVGLDDLHGEEGRRVPGVHLQARRTGFESPDTQAAICRWD